MKTDQDWPFGQIQLLPWWIQAVIWPPMLIVMSVWALLCIAYLLIMLPFWFGRVAYSAHRFQKKMRALGKLMSAGQVKQKLRNDDGWLLVSELATAGWWLPGTCANLSPEHSLLTWNEAEAVMQDWQRYRARDWVTSAMQAWADKFRSEGFEQVFYVSSTVGVDFGQRVYFLQDINVNRELMPYWQERVQSL